MRAKGTRGTGHPLGGHCLPPSCPAVHALAASRPPSHTHTHSPLPTLTCPLDHPAPPPPTHQPTRWIADNLEVGRPAEVNLFETTIRVLGGLLSAHALSRGSHPALAQRLAEKAADLGARLLPAFASPSGGQGRCKGGGGGRGREARVWGQPTRIRLFGVACLLAARSWNWPRRASSHLHATLPPPVSICNAAPLPSAHIMQAFPTRT